MNPWGPWGRLLGRDHGVVCRAEKYSGLIVSSNIGLCPQCSGLRFTQCSLPLNVFLPNDRPWVSQCCLERDS